MRTKDSRLKVDPSKTSRKYSLSIRSPATKSFVVNLEDIADPLVAIPPDGGWGWVIVAVSSCSMFCIDGIGYCFALFFEDISKEFRCQLTEIAIVSALLGGFYYLAGPLTCSAINRLGFQLISGIGGVLACVSFLSASFMTTLVPFLILVGCFGGTAFNLIYTPSVIAIGFYFEKWRALAMAISCCGSSLGVMCFPLIVVHLLGDLHWRTKFKVIGGVLGICGLLGLTFKPIKTTKIERPTVQFGHVSEISIFTLDESEIKFGGGIAGFFQRFKNALFPTISEVSVFSNHESPRSSLGYGYFLHKQEDEALSTYMQPDHSSEENLADRISTLGTGTEQGDSEKTNCCEKFRECCKRCCKCPKINPCCQKKEQPSYTNINRPLYRDDIFYSGSVFGLSQYSRHGGSHGSVPVSRVIPSLAYTLSVSRAPTQRDLDQQYQCVCCPEAFIRVIATMLDFQMLTSPTFILLLLSGYLSLMGTYIVFTYLPTYAIEKGIDPQFATMLLSIIGVSNTVGRAACGGVSCLPVLDIGVISWVTIIISGAAVTVTIIAYSATEHIIIYAIFGFNLASFAVLRALLFVELFGLENLTNCFGLNMIFQSLAAFSGTPIANFILHATGSFTMVFIFTGASIVLSGVLLIPIKCILRWEERRKKKGPSFR